MNEQDKTIPEQEVVTPEAVSADNNPETTAEEAVACENSEDKKDACVETESPAEAISEMTDATEGVAEAEGENAPMGLRKYHAMTKQQLVDALKEIVDQDNVAAVKDVAAIKVAFYSLHNQEAEDALMKYIDQGNAPENFVSPADPLEGQLKELNATFKEKRAAYVQAEEARLLANEERAQDILRQMKELTEDIDNINLNFNKFRELQQQFRDIKEVPAQAETRLWKEFQSVGEDFYDKLKVNRELRDLDFKKNLEAKEALIAEAEKLTDAPDPLQAFNRQKELQAQWREIGPVAKDYREDVWNRFREASTTIFKRHQDYFTARKAEEMAAQSRKVDLCERVEAIDIDAIDSFNKWEEETQKIKDLQTEWKEAGFASRKINNQLFARFREACDKFFEAKTAYYKATKESQNDNLAKKIALCERVEQLKESFDDQNLNEIRSACDKVSAAQKEWRTVGAVPRKQSDAVWKRFCDACQYFYELRKERTSGQRKEENANLAKKRDIVAQLKAIDTKADRQAGIDRMRQLQSEWQQTGHVPYKAKDALQEEYRQVVKVLHDELDVRGKRERLNNYGERLEKLSGDENQLTREREKLYRALDNKRSELKTAENNLGFFNVKSNSGSALLKEAQRRIDLIKEDMADIEKKIALLNEKID